jgi:hypothetical protein
VLALSAKSDYDADWVAAQCPGNVCTTRQAYDARQSARSKADAATVTMSVGGAVALGGVLLWALAPSSPSAPDVGRPRVAVGLASIAVTIGLP